MPRHKEPFLVKKRPPYWYWKPKNKNWRSTGIKLTEMTEKQLNIHLAGLIKNKPIKRVKLRDFAHDFFDWDKCDWIKRQHAKGRPFASSTAKSRRAHLINYIFPKLGNIELNDIKSINIEKWLLNINLSNQTKNHIIYTLNIILKEAKREGLIKHNPLSDIEPFARKYKKRDIFTLDQLNILFPKNEESLIKIWKSLKNAAMYMLMASTGIRSGEARALCWSHINWELDAVFVVQAVKANNEIGEPKAKEKRGVFIPKITLNILNRWYKDTPFYMPEDLIFFGMDKDRPLNKKTLLDIFNNALKIAGIDRSKLNLVPHSFRHTYNSLMRNILPETILREFTGHRSEKMTDRYDNQTIEDRLKKIQNSNTLVNKVFNW